MLKKLEIAKIKCNADVQPRLQIDQHTVEEYAELMNDKTQFPPVVVFWEEKKSVFWLADGFHRFEATKKLSHKLIECDVQIGTKRDAIFFACGANRNHPLTMSRADKRAVVMRLLTDDEWCKIADGEIAKHTGVSRQFVGYVRKEIGGEAVTKERKVKRGESEYVMDTSKMGGPVKPPSPRATLPDEPLHGPKDTLPPEPAPAPTEEEDQEEEDQIDEAAFDKAVVIYRAGYIVQAAMASLERRGIFADIPDLQEPYTIVGVAIDTRLRELSKMMPADTRAAVEKGVESVGAWIETGASKKEKAKTNPKSEASAEALSRVKTWERQIGLPPTKRPDAAYAKAFDEIHGRDGQPWAVIDEVIVAVKRWKDKGITITSPLALREKTGSKGSKKWEAAWMQYRDSDEYKPLRNPPKCPECGKTLVRMRREAKGKAYMSFFCKEHPEQSFKAGMDYCPDKVVK